MIERLTTGNKKQLTCAECNTSFSWNTIEEEVIMGNHVISCPNCGAKYIVPSSELLPYYNNNVVKYTENIYNDSEESGEGDKSSDSIFVFFGKNNDGTYSASKTISQIFEQIEYNNGTYERLNICGIMRIDFNGYGRLISLDLVDVDVVTSKIDSFQVITLKFIGYTTDEFYPDSTTKEFRKVVINYSNLNGGTITCTYYDGEANFESTPATTNLTGTAWRIPAGTDMTPEGKNGTFPDSSQINYKLKKGDTTLTSNGNHILYVDAIVGPAPEQIVFIEPDSISPTGGNITVLQLASPYQPDEDLVITITGGQDATKESLINWLETNAQQELYVDETEVDLNPAH